MVLYVIILWIKFVNVLFNIFINYINDVVLGVGLICIIIWNGNKEIIVNILVFNCIFVENNII